MTLDLTWNISLVIRSPVTGNLSDTEEAATSLYNTPCHYLEYVMSPLGKVVPQVMPEQVVKHCLCDPGGPHVRDVTLLTNERQVLRLFYEYSNNNHDQ